MLLSISIQRKRKVKEKKGGKAKKQGDEVGKKSGEDDEEYDCKPRTFVCRPFEHCECKLGFIPLMKKDRHRVGEVVRLYNQIDYHFQ